MLLRFHLERCTIPHAESAIVPGSSSVEAFNLFQARPPGGDVGGCLRLTFPELFFDLGGVSLNSVQAMTAGNIDVLTADGFFWGVQGAKSIQGQEPDGVPRWTHVSEPLKGVGLS